MKTMIPLTLMFGTVFTIIQLLQHYYQAMEILTQSRKHSNKQNHTNNKQILKLRIQLNDRIFQLHKLEEDHAQQKAQIYIQLQKDKYHYTKTIKELRDKLKEDNQQWATKIEQIRGEQEHRIGTLRHQIEESLKSKNKKHLDELQERYKTQIVELQAKIFQQSQHHQRLEQELIIHSKKNTQSLLQSHLKQHQQHEQQYKRSLNDLKKEYQTNMNKMQSIYLSQTLTRKQKESQLQNCIASHIKEKIIWGKTQDTLNSQIEKLNGRITQLESSLFLMEKQKQQMQLAHQTEITSLNTQFHTQINQITNKNQSLIQQTCLNYSSQIQLLHTQISSLVSIHKKKQQCWQQCGRRVLQLYQKRESKKQDVKAIQKLQVQLIKKDFLIERQRKELINCRLEMQNMEDVYDRIFIFSNSLNRSKAKSYHIKKTKNSCQLNQSNRSTITDKRYAQK